MVNGNHVAYYPPQMSNTQHAPCMVNQQAPPASQAQAQRRFVSQGQPQLPVYASNPYLPAFHIQPLPGYVKLLSSSSDAYIRSELSSLFKHFVKHFLVLMINVILMLIHHNA